MKKLFSLALALMAMAYAGTAQKIPYKVVFDITTKDSSMYQKVIRWINLIIKEHEDAEIEVVFYGQSLPMVTSGQSNVGSEVVRLARMKQVQFTVCEQAMQVHHISKAQLLEGVKTVPDGIYEIICRQADGYGYIKATQ